jgi:hypothetical protein
MQPPREIEMEAAKATTVHIFVEINKNDQRKVEFESDHVTGGQIKAAAGVPAGFDIARRIGQKLGDVIKDDQVIEIKEGEHFVAVPAGTVS